MNNHLDKCKGALLGLAIGDALGTTVEFLHPNTFEPMTDLVGGGVFKLEAGKWTDDTDTSMALCLADSLIEKKEFDAFDQMDKYYKWFSQGYNSSEEDCVDIGNATRSALYRFDDCGQPYCGDPSRSNAGNGSIMRLAPIGIFYQQNISALLKYAALSSKTTHSAPQCINSCKFLAYLISEAIAGTDKKTLLSDGFWKFETLDESLNEILNGKYKEKNPPEINGAGYVITTLEAALWAFYHTNTFEEGALKVVNLGRDADTTGAVYGQIAGAFYGLESIPVKWLDKLYQKEHIESLAEKLYALSLPS